MPNIRVDKEFACPLEELDEEALYQEASQEIRAAQQAYNELQAQRESSGNE